MIRSRLAILVLVGTLALLTGCTNMPVLNRLTSRFRNGPCGPPISDGVLYDSCSGSSCDGGPILGPLPGSVTSMPFDGTQTIVPPVTGTPRLIPTPQSPTTPYTP